VRPVACGAILLMVCTIASHRGVAADAWGGSLSLTSDYLVRGISRSDDQGALQLELHYVNADGLFAGAFASNSQVDSAAPREVELSAFAGFTHRVGEDWRGKALLTYYAYPGSTGGSNYDYLEVSFDVIYQEWLEMGVVYSPNAPRFLPYRGVFAADSTSLELSLQRPVVGKLSATGGVGYSYLNGEDAGGYCYWSLGAAYDLAPVSIALSYVDTSAGGATLFYNAAARGRWTGTLIWRF
jgi:uncharacterized protein (TIGR02001 family)